MGKRTSLIGGKESTCNAGHTRSIPGFGRSSGEGKGYSLQYLACSMDCILHGVAKSRTRLSDFQLMGKIDAYLLGFIDFFFSCRCLSVLTPKVLCGNVQIYWPGKRHFNDSLLSEGKCQDHSLPWNQIKELSKGPEHGLHSPVTLSIYHIVTTVLRLL